MSVRIFFFVFLLNFLTLYSQKKDTIFIILQDDVFSKSVNDTLIIDKKEGWINIKQVGKTIYPNLKNARCLNGVRTDTLLLGEDVIKGRYMIRKYIYASNIDYTKEKLRDYLKTVDSCDKIHQLDLNNNEERRKFISNHQFENKNRQKLYKCYHENLKEKNVSLTPYSFWRNDSKSDLTITFDTIYIREKPLIIKSNSRVYKTLEEIEKSCKYDSKSSIKCFRISRKVYPNLGLADFEALDDKKYVIYINEEFIPENFYNNNNREKSKKIMLNEYYFNRNYHKYR